MCEVNQALIRFEFASIKKVKYLAELVTSLNYSDVEAVKMKMASFHRSFIIIFISTHPLNTLLLLILKFFREYSNF